MPRGESGEVELLFINHLPKDFFIYNLCVERILDGKRLLTTNYHVAVSLPKVCAQLYGI